MVKLLQPSAAEYFKMLFQDISAGNLVSLYKDVFVGSFTTGQQMLCLETQEIADAGIFSKNVFEALVENFKVSCAAAEVLHTEGFSLENYAKEMKLINAWATPRIGEMLSGFWDPG